MWGKDDTVVDPNQSRQMASALKGAGKPVETLELVGEDHWMSHQATRIQAIKASVPLSTMFGYATHMRSSTQGRANYSMQFKQYEEAPKSVSEEIIAKVQGKEAKV